MSSLSMVPKVLRSAPAATARSLAMPWAAAMASCRLMSLKIWSHSPETWAMAALDVDDLGDARQLLRDQERPAADGDQRHVARLGLHAVDRLLGQAGRFGQHLLAGCSVELGDLLAIAELQQTCCHGDVGRRELLAAKRDAVLQQAVTDRYRTDLQWIEHNVTAAAQA